MYPSHTGMNTDTNHGFPTTSNVGYVGAAALNIASNVFPSTVGIDTPVSGNSLSSASLVELFKNPQAFERYNNWKLSERCDTLYKQNINLHQQVASLQQQINTLKVELDSKQNTKYVKFSIFNI